MGWVAFASRMSKLNVLLVNVSTDRFEKFKATFSILMHIAIAIAIAIYHLYI